jgi:flagellar motor protein MotB
VVRFLVAKGVDPAMLSAAGFGDTRPVASNGTAAGRAKNRRIEIVLRSASN